MDERVVVEVSLVAAHGDVPAASGEPLLGLLGLALAAGLLAWFLVALRLRSGRRAGWMGQGRIVSDGWRDRSDVLAGVVILSAAAGAVHAGVTPEHFEEHVMYGLFFVSAAVAQVGWSLWLLLRPLSRTALLAGVAANGFVAFLWVVSRTAGVPFGPESGEREAVGVVDALASASEVGIVTGCIILLRGVATSRPPSCANPRAGEAFGGKDQDPHLTRMKEPAPADPVAYELAALRAGAGDASGHHGPRRPGRRAGDSRRSGGSGGDPEPSGGTASSRWISISRSHRIRSISSPGAGSCSAGLQGFP